MTGGERHQRGGPPGRLEDRQAVGHQLAFRLGKFKLQPVGLTANILGMLQGTAALPVLLKPLPVKWDVLGRQNAREQKDFLHVHRKCPLIRQPRHADGAVPIHDKF